MSSEKTRRLALPALLLATLAACGKQGDPAPRPRAIPQPAKDLVAMQRGDQVVLGLSYPASTMAGLPLAGIESATVYLAPWPAPVAGEKVTITDADLEKGAKPVHVLAGTELADAIVGGKLRIRLSLPEGVPAAPPAAVAPAGATAAAPPAAPSPAAPAPAAAPVAAKAWVYAVRTLAKGGELSPFSNAVLLVPQPLPPAPSDLSVTAKKEGVALHWSVPAASTAGIVVLRRDASTPDWGDPLALLPAGSTDHLDRTAALGTRYIYAVISRSASTLPVESAPTSEREVDYRDVFAPEAPTALRALAVAGEVRLVWEASPDGDVAGYLVERAAGTEEFARLTPQPIDALEFSDRTAPADVPLRYRAIAVDRAGNSSAPSEIAESQGPLP